MPTNPEGSAEGAEATSTPQQRAVIERYLKLSDSRPGAPRLSVKSKPNQPLEVSHPSSADGAGLALAFGTTEGGVASILLNSLINAACDGTPVIHQASKTSTAYSRRFMGSAPTTKSRRCWQSRWLRRISLRHARCAV
jgi:hypothetical protein